MSAHLQLPLCQQRTIPGTLCVFGCRAAPGKVPDPFLHLLWELELASPSKRWSSQEENVSCTEGGLKHLTQYITVNQVSDISAYSNLHVKIVELRCTHDRKGEIPQAQTKSLRVDRENFVESLSSPLWFHIRRVFHCHPLKLPFIAQVFWKSLSF